MKICFCFIFIFASTIIFGQKVIENRILQDERLGNVLQQINHRTGDTSEYSPVSSRFTVRNKEGVLTVDGHKWGGMGTYCGCSAVPHGYWTERYENGNLKEHGQYFCKRKFGDLDVLSRKREYIQNRNPSILPATAFSAFTWKNTYINSTFFKGGTLSGISSKRAIKNRRTLFSRRRVFDNRYHHNL